MRLRFNNSPQARLLAGMTGDLIEVEESEIVHPTLGHLCMLVGSVRDNGYTKLWLSLRDVPSLTTTDQVVRQPPPKKIEKKPPPKKIEKRPPPRKMK